MFYKQLLHAQISKGQKRTDNWTVFFALLESVRVKASSRILMKSTTSRQFHQHSMYYMPRSQKRKKDTDALTVFFYAFGLYEHKSCAKNIGEIDYQISICFASHNHA